ncbi:hypothetical protein FPQ18DRAFT_267053 [Pyronema domesticum]|nr:hypothetical protein FPQ18DRAFT_267053 [Pyronema domesticum]
MSSSSVIEKELTCSICTEILFDPITLLNCLHHNCGSCAKRWFSSPHQQHQAPTCPVCRRPVKGAGVSPMVVNFLEDFLSRNPSKARTPEEIAELRAVWKPGDDVLPAVIQKTEEDMDRMMLRPASVTQLQRVRPPRTRSPPRAPRRPSLPSPTQSNHPSRVLDILHRSTPTTPIIITCDACSQRLDSSVHMECTSTCSLFHLCLRCYRSGHTCSPAHALTRQKLIPSWPRRYLQSGVFCDVCDVFLDEERSGASVGAMFWRCITCAGEKGGWNVCTGCVARGWNCTHELTLFTNSRTPSPGLLRGVRSWQEGGYHPWLWTGYQASCAVCKLPAQGAAWIHCFACEGDKGDLCTTCFYNLHRTFPSQQRAVHRFFTCHEGHTMGVLAQMGKMVVHRGVFAHAPKPRPPEWLVGREGKRAVAEKGYWPEEEGENQRPWGKGQWLCFPEGAEVLDVVVAFEEGDVWCWGSYAGVGGLFPGGCVRVIEEA